MDLHDGDERGVEVVGLGLLCVEDLDRVRPAGNGEDGASEEVLRELLSIEGGRCYDEFEVRTTLDCLCNEMSVLLRKQGLSGLTLEKTEQDIGSDGPLVRLVQHDDGILSDVGVNQALTLKHTVRHVLDTGLWTRTVLETDGVADFLTKTATDFFRHTLRH